MKVLKVHEPVEENIVSFIVEDILGHVKVAHIKCFDWQEAENAYKTLLKEMAYQDELERLVLNEGCDCTTCSSIAF